MFSPPSEGPSKTPLDIIEPIARTCPEELEAQSTEELMRQIEETNKRFRGLKSGNHVVVASMDVLALYPSLDQRESARIVKEEFEALVYKCRA